MVEGMRNYPMMSTAAWRGLRDQFQKEMPDSVSRSYVASVLGISERGAANLLGPMRSLGLIDPDGTPTDRARQWCMNDGYPSVCAAMLGDVYPEDLRNGHPDPKEDRVAVIQWFKENGGVGQAGATKMAATYELIAQSSAAPEIPVRGPAAIPGPVAVEERTAPLSPDRSSPARPSAIPLAAAGRDVRQQASESHVLHRDIHVHIAADASAEQIDQIFASMARHLRGGS